MKSNQSALIVCFVCLFFNLFLVGCSGQKTSISKSQMSYNIIVPAVSGLPKDLTINIKADQVSIITNDKVAAVAKVRPAPPPPPPCSGCKPPGFIFTLVSRNTAEIYYPQLDRRLVLDITNISDELVRGIMSLPNKSFEAQPMVN